MFSRFWYFVIAAVTGFALAAGLLAETAINHQSDAHLDDQLRRDRLEVELRLRLDARARLDAIGPMAAHGDVRQALRAASARHDRSAIDTALRDGLATTLGALNRQLDEAQADVLFGVDASGGIVAQLGGSPPPPTASLGAMPLVAQALRGFMGDDVWLWNGKAYRMVARPVIDAGRYVGAIVHGMELDEELARRLAEQLPGASVGFFVRDGFVASFAPNTAGAPGASDLAQDLAAATADEQFTAGNASAVMALGEQGRAVYSKLAGTAAAVPVGYAIGRPRHLLASPVALFQESPREDLLGLDWPLIVGLSVFLAALGVLALFLERDRPFHQLREAVGELARSEVDRLPSGDFRGRWREIADHINRSVDRASEAHASLPGGGPRRSADLDELLGPTPDRASTPYFGFAGDADAGADIPEVPAAAARPKPASTTPSPTPLGVPDFAPRSHPGAQSTTPARAPVPAPAPVPVPVPAPAPAPAPVPAPAPAPVPASTTPSPAPLGVPVSAAPSHPGAQRTTPAPVPAPVPAPLPPPAPAPRPSLRAADFAAFEEDDGATMVADIPGELVAAATVLSPEQAEESHFKDVYNQFVATKRKCGEPTAGLTYEKFVVTLRKNRDQIVARHGAKSVRFTVYVKDGKAALKATPDKG